MKVIGLGAGGHAKGVIEILRQSGQYDLVGFLDANAALYGTEVMGIPVLGGDDLLPQLANQGIRSAFIGVGSVGNTRPRQRLYEQARQQGFQIVPVLHSQAVISPSVEWGEGVTVMAAAVINAAAKLGENVLINTATIVEHDCWVGSHTHIASGARLAGNVWIGEGCHIGLGATILQGVRIGRNTIVGAGAVVIDPVPDQVVVVGVPARIVRTVMA